MLSTLNSANHKEWLTKVSPFYHGGKIWAENLSDDKGVVFHIIYLKNSDYFLFGGYAQIKKRSRAHGPV